jgi:hypothetical protein
VLLRGSGEVAKIGGGAPAGVVLHARRLLHWYRAAQPGKALSDLEDRYGWSSTVLTSQVPTKQWHEMLADPTVADAICDRVVHNAHVLAVRGPSIRQTKGMQTDH